ncbi:hemagglutinin repeat-containing protein [Polaromonas sp. YR568]|uniref:hemagglutinin repeat-containing protein n=1 Tax=Polaromonas sp. YR568 TaxID=1855301 RepID=UPI00398BFDC6
MNKNLHRIVFNAKRGQLMAVAETASAQGKTASGETRCGGLADGLMVALHPVRFAVLAALGMVLTVSPLAHAQIVADPNALANQRPTVLNAANGVPQVNIQTPSAAGVSRNVYNQFDVQRNGAVLNNSRTNVQTQLGGFVQGNPWLATGSARVILNEVNSVNPSQLRGYVEVAGQRAEVIIANPAGINIDGGGFLNANRVTLTTGTPVINGGSLDAYRVQGGVITINGAGLDTSTADYTGIMARAVQVNSGIWAKELKVTTGANQIDAAQTGATPIAGTGAAPTFALDVAQLGGMYAGKIFLVGTEAGVGINNSGVIGATAGDVALQSNGWLSNRGSIQANGNTQISTAGPISNSGAGAVISAQGNASITTGAGLTNEAGAMMVATGTLAANAAGAIQNTQSTLAANGGVTINAASLSNASGTIASVAADLSVTTTGATGNTVAGGAAQGARMSAAGTVSLSNTGLSNTGSSITGGAINIDTHQQAFNNTGGTVSASTTATINSGALANTAGLIQSTGALAINTHGQTLSNTNAAAYSGGAGGITSQGAVSLVTGDLDNAAGSIGAKGALTASTANFGNAGGQIVSEAAADFTTTGFNNSGGQLQAAGNVSIAAGPGSINNTGGLVRSGETVTLAAGSVVNSNTSGVDRGLEGKNLSITAASVANDSGAMRTSANATVTSSGSLNNNAGLISAGNTATLQDTAAVKTLAITNAGGTVIAGTSLAANAASLGGNGSLLSQQDLSLTLTGDFSNTGQVIANRDLSIVTTGNISNRPTAGDLTSGKLQAGRSLTLSAGNIDNAYEAVISATNTTVTAANSVTNRGLIDGQETRINAATLANIGTGAIYGKHLAIAATTINNSSETVNGTRADAVIAARERLDIGTQTLNNGEGALIFSGGSAADALNISGGLDAGGHATGQAGVVNNSGGTIESLGGLSIMAGQINNTNPNFAYTVQTGSASSGSGREYITAQGNYSPNDVGWVVSAETYKTGIGGGYAYWDTTGLQQIYGGPGRWASETSEPPPYTGHLNTDGKGRLLLKGAPYSDLKYQKYFLGPSAYVPAHNLLTGARESLLSTPVAAFFGYDASSPVWDDFGVARPQATSDVDPTPWIALQAQIDAMRMTVVANAVAVEGFRDYTSSPQTPVVTQSAPGRILSAGAMTLHAATSLVNDQSQIVAGGALNITGQAVDNRGRTISVNAQRNGTAYFWSNYNEGCGGFDGCDYNYNAYRDGPYTQDVPQTVVLNLFRKEDMTSPASLGLATGTEVHNAAGTSVGTNTNTPGALSAAGVRTVPVNIRVPTTSLFRLNPNPAGGFLIETDPRFANYRNWLGSDYMLAQLSLDPSVTQKRLGDGFYEQRLVNEQVAQLTGQRFLGNYSSDEDQYKALMDAGITYAQQYQLRPGIALTAAQMAQLTSDIVWLVEQEVTLADGSKTRALVPQVYVHVKDGDLAPNGALLAGKSVNINLAGDMTNTGSVAGRTVVNLTAENVQNLGGRITGDAITVAARNDLNNIGGQIIAASSLNASAGRDLNIVTTTSSASNQTGTTSANSFSMTGIDRVAGLYVTGGPLATGTLVASAGRDVSIIAGVISNNATGGSTVISAGNNINLGTVATGSSSLQSRGEDHFLKDSQTADVGSQLQTAGNLSLIAGNDLNAKAANVQAGGDLTASAGNNVNITEGRQTNSFGFALTTAESDLFSSSSTTERRGSEQNNAVGSSLGGSTVTVVAGKDINVKGSNIISDTGTTLAAGNNLTIEAAQNTGSASSFYETKESGLLDGEGAGITVGTREQSTDQKNQYTTAAASTVGSIAGNVTLVANESYKQIGSDVMAPGGDITILAKKVDIVEARETSRSETEQKFKQTGLTLEVTSPVISAMQTIDKMSEAAGDTKDARMQGLALANAGFAGKNAYDAVKAGQGTDFADKSHQVVSEDAAGNVTSRDATAAEQAGGINLAISIGSSESQSNSLSQSNTARGSAVTAGGTITIAATGAGADSNLTIQGSNIEAGRAVQLLADNQVKLLAAQNTASEKSTNSNSSGSIGVSFGTDGLLLNLSASGGKGRGDGEESTYTNTQVKAGDQVSITSGGDTTLQGAVVKANQVKADVGGNLNIQSLQDTSTYTSEQKSMGGSLSVGYGKMSGSFSASESSIDSNFKSVGEQSGIKAGDGGFQVNVGGNTTLTGSVIASTDKAVTNGANSFNTGGTLTIADIQNVASYEAKSVSISMGTSQQPTGKLDMSGLGIGIGSDKGDASSISSAGISGIAGNTAVRSTDAETGLQKIFDADRVQREIAAQTQITQYFGQQATKAVGDYAQTKLNEAAALRDQANNEPNEERKNALKAQATELESNWGNSGVLRVALHTVIGGLTGGVGGAAGAGVGTLTAPMVAQALADAGVTGPLAQTLTAIASTAVGVAAGGTAGGAAAANEVINNYLKHSEVLRLKREIEDCKSRKCSDVDYQKILNAYISISEANNASLAACTTQSCLDDHIRWIAEAKPAADDILRFVDDGQRNAGVLAAMQRTSNLVDTQQKRIITYQKQAEEFVQYAKVKCAGAPLEQCIKSYTDLKTGTIRALQDAKEDSIEFWKSMADDPNQSVAKAFISVTGTTLASLMPSNTAEIALLIGPGLLSKIGATAEMSAIIDLKAFTSIYSKAPAAKIEIDLLAEKIAADVGGQVAKAPIKSVDRAIEKIVEDYAGDPSKIKDLARNTIIVKDEMLSAVTSRLESSGATVKVINSSTDPLGYSGINTTITTKSGITAEIQVNTPAMIYAKESESVARALLGNDTYNLISKQAGIPGGQGHLLYDQWRVLPSGSAQAQSIAAQSKAYYDLIRSATNGH